MFEPGQRVGVAVSGGADSVCLLEVLRQLAPRWDLRLSVVHLDHQLRGLESRADAEFVARLAARAGLEFHLRETAVAARAGNLEEQARRARHEFFLGLLGGGALDRVATGHTRSDQAETVLFRLLRGSGAAGLSGIRPTTREGLVRPLLVVTRAEVRAYLQERGLPWREDSSNSELAFDRNRIRHELLPLLERDWNPRLAEALARTAETAQDEESYWEAETARLAAQHFSPSGPSLILRAGGVAGLPRAAARRLLRLALQQVKGDLRGIDWAHVEQTLRLAESPGGRGRVQAPGVEVRRSLDWIRLAPAGLPLPARSMEIQPPGSFPAPDGATRIEILPAEPGAAPGPDLVEAPAGSAPWLLRPWTPGDRYQPFGFATPQKLKTLFQRARLPVWERAGWPVLLAAGQILWTRRFGAAARPESSTRRSYRILESNPLPCASE